MSAWASADAAVLLCAMTGVDAADPATAAQAGHAHTNYVQFLDIDAPAVRGSACGATAILGLSALILMSTRSWKRRSRRWRPPARSSDELTVPFEDAWDPEWFVLLCELKTYIASYLETYNRAGLP